MNGILIVDDRTDFTDEFSVLAGGKGYKVKAVRSFDGLKEQMPKLHQKISVVILDIKCLLTDNQEIEDEGFISTALRYLDTNFPNFPRIILTGDDSSFEGFSTFNNDENVYLKTPEDLEKIFEKIKYYADNSEDLKIRREYADIFQIFENGLMETAQEIQVLNILKQHDEKNPTKFKGIIVDIRSVQEMIYKKINEKNKTVVPDRMIRNNMIKFNDLMHYLNGSPTNNRGDKIRIPVNGSYQNSTIFNLADSLYWSCGEYIHEELNRPYMISNMALKSLIFNLMELLIWSKQYLR